MLCVSKARDRTPLQSAASWREPETPLGACAKQLFHRHTHTVAIYMCKCIAKKLKLRTINNLANYKWMTNM